MADLPKRGDRVRVTEAFPGAWLETGNVVTLDADAVNSRSFGDACEFTYRVPGMHVAIQGGPVKVEILERADQFDCCGGSDEHPPEHTQDCSSRQESERVCADCGMPVSHRVHRGFGPCGGRSVKTVHPEFARGMRRAVEIALEVTRQFGRNDIGRALKDATEQELKDGW